MKHLYLPVLLTLLSVQIGAAQTFKLSNDFPEAGKKVTLTYQLESPLPKSKAPTVIVHFVGVKDYKKVAYAWDNDYKAEQIQQLQWHDNAWNCEIFIPAKARVFYVTWQPDQYTIGSDQIVYRHMVYLNKKPLSGAYVLNTFIRDVPVSTITDIDGLGILDSYRKEYELYPDSPFRLSYDGIVGSVDSKTLLEKVAGFEKSDVEKVMMMGSGLLRAMWQIKEPGSVKMKLATGVSTTGDYVYPYRQRADSLDEVIKVKFPHGITMKAALTNAYFKEKNFEKKEALLADLIKRCPQDAVNTRALLRTESAIYYLQDFDIVNYQKQFRLLKKDDESLAYNANEIIYHWALKGEHLPEMEMIAKQVLAIIITNINKPANRPYKEAYLKGYYSYLDTYAYILFKRGKLAEAVKRQSAAYRGSKGENPEMNEHYVTILNAAGKYQLALQIAEDCMKRKKSTPELYEQFKIAYDRVHPNKETVPADSFIKKSLKP